MDLFVIKIRGFTYHDEFKILWIGDIWIYHWIISKFNQFLSSYVPVGASSELRLVYKNIIHYLRPAGCMPTDRCMSLSLVNCLLFFME